jgi:hypothetical protein
MRLFLATVGGSHNRLTRYGGFFIALPFIALAINMPVLKRLADAYEWIKTS